MSKMKALGIYSAAGTYVLITAFSYQTGALEQVLSELPWLLSGQTTLIRVENFSILTMAKLIAASISLSIFAALLSVLISLAIFGKVKGGMVWQKFADLSKIDRNTIPKSRLFMAFFFWVLLEELVARWFFLGVLTKVFTGPLAFFILFIIGNGLWALSHKENFSDESDKKSLRVLPQFLLGIVLTYIFVKFGLLACVLTHFGHNAIIFATDRIENINGRRFWAMVYLAVAAVGLFLLQTKPLSDITIWFATNPTFKLVGWEFWDYILFDFWFSVSIILLFLVLCYDGFETVFDFEMLGNQWRANKSQAIISQVIALSALALLVMLATYLLFLLCGLITDNLPYRILILTIISCFMQFGRSLSSVSKVFWIAFPQTYIMICVIQALDGASLIFAYFFLKSLLMIPLIFITAKQVSLQRINPFTLSEENY